MRFRPLAALTFLVLALAACSRSYLEIQPTATPTAKPVSTQTLAPTPTIVVNKLGAEPGALRGTTVKVWHAWQSPQKELFEAQIAEFNRQNEWGITVRAEPYPEYAALFEAVSAAQGTIEAPDLVVALPEYIYTWDSRKLIVDLTDYTNHPEIGLPQADQDDIPAVVWAQDMKNNRRLALPAERSMRLMVVNSQWAKELGFTSLPANADQFQQQACAANTSFKSDQYFFNDGYGGWLVDTDRQNILAWLAAFDGGVLDDGAYDFITEENEAALAYIKGLFDSNCAWVYTGESPYSPFIDRLALFTTLDLAELDYFTRQLAIAGNTDTWLVTGFPGPNGNKVTVYGPSYAVMRTTPEEQLAAWLFARAMLSAQNQAQWVKTTGLLPLRKSAMELLKDYRLAHPQWAMAVKLMDNGTIEPQAASWRTVKYVLADGANIIFRANIPIENIPDVLWQMQKTAEELSK